MTLWKTEHAAQPRTGRPISGPAGYPDFAALAVIGGAPAVLLLWIAWIAPVALVLPFLSIASFAIACAAALFAHYSGNDRRVAGVTAWDISALFTAIWIVAGLSSGARPLAGLLDSLAVSP
jgi:hypothetical protein